MPDQVSLLFSRLSELAIAEGVVPEDGSGVDGVWTTTIPAPDRDRDWRVAMNADTDQEQTVADFPGDGDDTTVSAGTATIWLGEWPAGVLTPFDGTLAVEVLDDGPASTEDELIDDIDARIDELDEDGGRDD